MKAGEMITETHTHTLTHARTQAYARTLLL